MPTKQRYQKLKSNRVKCPKCGGQLDDKDFATCSRCRLERKSKPYDRAEERKQIRRDAMSLFGVKRW